MAGYNSSWRLKFPDDQIPDDFFEWLESVTSDFRTRKDYDPLNEYIKQADKWLADKTKINDFYDKEDKEKFRDREILRIRENSLFFLDKYHTIIDGDMGGMGMIDYKAEDAQRILSFLFDNHLNLLIGKARQIWFTSTMGGLFIKRVCFFSGYYALYVADEVKKAERIFKEKMRYSFFGLPEWLRSTPSNVRDDMLAFAGNPKKGQSGLDSRLEVVSPRTTSATGEAPSLIGMDEIGLNKGFSEMMSEMLPALYKYNPKTGKQERTRQMIAWGCVCAGTKVWDNKGNFINIEDLQPEDGILGYDGETTSKEEITYWQPPAEKECYRITTNTGRFLECSDDHPILWSNKKYGITPRSHGRKFFKQKKFVEVKNIKIGDQVAVIESVQFFGVKEMWEPRVIGWLIGDGSYGYDSTPVLSNCDKEINDYIEYSFDITVEKGYKTKDGRDYKETRIRNICGKLRELGIYGQTKLKKTLPENIHSYDKDTICELLGGFFDTDGCVHYTKKHTYIDLTSSSFSLLDEVRFLLQKLGIHSRISRIKANLETNSKDKNDWYVLYISDKRSVYAFFSNISFYIRYKQERLAIIVQGQLHKREKISRNIKGLRFERVVDVQSIGRKPVYNLTAGGTNTYIANGIVTHNTGGKMESGGAEMETEWNAAREAWKKRNGEYPLIPVMFDVWARPGVDKVFYEKRKKEAYSKKGPESENFRIKFHQHYPTSEQDMFLQTIKTLIPYDEIVAHIDRIYALVAQSQPKYGYFKPVYNHSEPSGPESDTPYKIVGSIFMPTQGAKDPSTTSVMFQEPEPDWEDRYYKGTDPISAETGHSLMSSSIWDDYANTIPCVMNWRIREYKQVFLQSLLMGIHYSPYIKDLVEINNGEFYINYVESKGFGSQLVTNLELPKEMQIGSGPTFGINNRGHVPMHIIHALQGMLGAYAKNIYIVEFFQQLKTFVEKTLTSGKTRYQAKDLKYWRDDVIFGAVYSYICAQCFRHYKPKQIDYNQKNEPIRKFDYDENFNLRLAEFDRDGKRIRFLDHITYDT